MNLELANDRNRNFTETEACQNSGLLKITTENEISAKNVFLSVAPGLHEKSQVVRDIFILYLCAKTIQANKKREVR